MDSEHSVEKGYDPEWIDHIITHFGLEYLKDKEKSILINLKMIINSSNENCCGRLLEKLFYKEAVLFGAYRYYYNLFLNFYDEQQPTDQAELKARKEATVKILRLIDKGVIQRSLIGRGKPRKQLSEIQAKKYNKDIYNYFKEHPPACDLDPFRELEKFRKAIGFK